MKNLTSSQPVVQFFCYMDGYAIPFQDVYDLHNVIFNECLPFEAFNSLKFSVTDVNLTEYHRNPLDDIDTQINNNIDVAISNCKYYDSQKFKPISSNNNFSLLFCDINSLKLSFENYFLS